MNIENLKQILSDQKSSILSKSLGVEREKLSEIKSYQNIPHVVVITGLRRVGKSTFLRQIINRYYDDQDFYYINFEDERLLNFKAEDFNIIYETLIELFGEKKTFFIDEIQNIRKFENFVRRFYDSGFKFYISGSNASLLSREIGSKLTGRHVDLEINPFSFKEFLTLKKFPFKKDMVYKTESKGRLKHFFNQYLLNGGMPEFLLYKEPEILSRIYDDILIKDIVARYNITNLYEMRELYLYLISNFCNRFSFTRLKKLIGLGSVNTIKNYITYLSDTYFISIVNKFDYSLKKQIVNEKKIYVIDNGFIPLISTKLNRDKGWLLENLVYNRLNKRKDVFYFNHNQKECDFIVQSGKKIEQAIQVCWNLSDDNKEREYNGLLEALDYLDLDNGTILTADQDDKVEIHNKKIKTEPVWKWLLREEK